MSDRTLLNTDIARAVKEVALLEPFNRGNLRGVSYDFSVGRTMIVIHSESEGGIQATDLQVKRKWTIPPGRAAIVYSLEKVRMPLSMKGRLSLRARQATKLLFFAGGPIDPGYKGYLFLPLVNLSDAPIELSYGEAIVTGEFVELAEEADPYPAAQLDSIPEDRLPPVPADSVYDLARLTGLAEELQAAVVELRTELGLQQPRIEATSRVVDFVLLGAVAGVLLGTVGGGIVAAFAEVPTPWNFAAGFGTIIIAAIAAFWLRDRFLALRSASPETNVS